MNRGKTDLELSEGDLASLRAKVRKLQLLTIPVFALLTIGAWMIGGPGDSPRADGFALILTFMDPLARFGIPIAGLALIAAMEALYKRAAVARGHASSRRPGIENSPIAQQTEETLKDE